MGAPQVKRGVRLQEDARLHFATPDFGAGGMVVCVCWGSALTAIGVEILCAVRGVILSAVRHPRRKWPGIKLIVAGVLIPVTLCERSTACCSPEPRDATPQAIPRKGDIGGGNVGR